MSGVDRLMLLGADTDPNYYPSLKVLAIKVDGM